MMVIRHDGDNGHASHTGNQPQQGQENGHALNKDGAGGGEVEDCACTRLNQNENKKYVKAIQTFDCLKHALHKQKLIAIILHFLPHLSKTLDSLHTRRCT